MKGRNHRRWLILSLLLAGLVWGVILLFSTKPTQLWLLRRTVGFEEIDFEQAQFSWGEAYIEDIELEAAGIRLQARETRVTFSVWKALLGQREAIDDLRFSKARLSDMDPTNRPWPGRILTTLEGWRPRKDLLRFGSMSLEGIWERMNDTDLTIVARAGPLDFSDQGKLEMQVGPSIGNQEDLSPEWLVSGALSWSRISGKLLLAADGNATLFADNGVSVGSNQFSSGLTLSEDGQSMEGEWMDGERTVCQIDLSRPSTDMPFSGLGNLVVNQRDLGAFWMPFNLFRIETATEISVQWHPENGIGACELQLDGNASSFLFRHLGQVSLELQSNFRYGLEGIVSEGLEFRLTTGRGELLQGSQSGRLSFPGLLGEEAKVALKLEKARMDWFSSRILTPSKFAVASWELPEFSLEGGQDNGIWRFSVSPFNILDGDERLAAVDKLLVQLVDANSSQRNLSFKFEGTMERRFLSEVLPNFGPLGVFDAEDARGLVSGEVLFSNEGVVLRQGALDLASAVGGRQFRLRCENEINLDPNQPDFVSSDLRGELLSVQGNRLPMDGLIRWADGEAQGDLDAFSGKISRDDRGWVFLSDEAVEITNAQVVRQKVNYGEGLRAKADLEVILDREGGLLINADNLSLEGDERTSFTGALSLLAKPSGSGHLFATKLESTNLKVDLTTLTWLGFSEFPDLETGSLNIGKLKASFGDDFSLEVDGALEDFRVVDEAPMTGGLQATVRSQPDGFSTWARLSLVRENRESDATLDVFLPSDGNASRRKLSLSGEELHLDELLAFATTIPAPADREALLTGQRFPGWARGTWELGFDVLLVKGLPPFKEVKAKLFLQPRDLLLASVEGQWLDGVVLADGSLSLGSPDEPGVRLQNFNARATQALLQNLTKRIKGPVDAQLSGWAEGTGWNDALKRFSGQVKVTARNGLLRLGPLAEEGAEEAPSQDPWSLIRLSKLLEGKASVSDSRKTLLQKMDSALGDVSYDLVQVIGQRSLDGNFSVTELSVLGPAFKVSGKGKVTSFPEGEGGGTLNLNLSVGARGELVEILKELGVLAPVKAEGEYRMLKKNPLVVQGTMEKPDFSNFWALLAEGLGLGGFDTPEPD